MSQITTSAPSISNIEIEQLEAINTWIRERIPDDSKEYIDDISDLTDHTHVLHTNLKRLGFDKVILVPMKNRYTKDVVYEPYFAAVALAKTLGYRRYDAIGSTLLKEYYMKTIGDIEPLKNNEGQIIVPESLNIKEIKQIKFTDFNGAKHIVTHVAHSNDSRFKQYKSHAQRILRLLSFMTKLNQIIMSYKHLQSMNVASSKPTTITDTCKEQEGMMREWVISQLPTDTRSFFNGVTRPWDPVEFLTSNIMRYGFNEIIMVPTKNKLTGKTYYEPYFVIYKLAKYLHYTNPENTSKLFKNQVLYTLSDLCKKYSSEIIVPNHLKTNQLNQMKFGDFKCAKQLIEHVAYSNVKSYAAGKPIAVSLLNAITDISIISKDLIDAMNQLVAEYRHQQQLIKAKDNEQKLLKIEQYKKDIEDQKKRLEEETRLFALQAHPDIAIKKSHYGYIFSSEDYMKKDLYKIGITDNLKGREVSAHTYHPEGGFLYTIETYNAKVTEASLHQVLKDYRLQYKINSGDEWFKIPGLDEAKRLLDLAINNTGAIYEHVASYASQLRDRIINPPIQAIMPSNTNTINEEPPITDFVKDVINKIGLNKDVYKTDLLKTIRTMINDIKYKKHKTKLPTNVEMFTTSADTSGIKAEVKESGRVTRIRFIIEVDIDTNDD